MPIVLPEKLKLYDRRKVYDMEDEEILKLAQLDWTESTNHWQQVAFPAFTRWLGLYNLVNPVSGTPTGTQTSVIPNPNTRANNFYGLVTIMVDTIQAIIAQALFPGDDFFTVKPGKVYSDIDTREAAKDFLQYDLRQNRTDAVRKFTDEWLKQALLYWWSVARVGYRVAGRNVIVEQESIQELVKKKAGGALAKVLEKIGFGQGDIKISGIPAYKIAYDPAADQCPEFEVLNTMNTRPDPKALDFDGLCRYFMYEKDLSIANLLANVKDNKNRFGLYETEPTQKLIDDIGNSQQETLATTQTGEASKGSPKPVQPPDVLTIRIWANEYAEFATDQNFKYVLRRRKKDGWDFKKMVFFPRVGEWRAYCIPERLEMHNLQINSVANSRSDNVNFGIDGLLVVNDQATSLLNPTDNKNFPGKHFMVQGDVRAAAAWLFPQDVTSRADEEISFIERWAQRLIAPNENVQGSYKAGGSTATESEIVANYLSTRMQPIISRIGQNDLHWLLNAIMKQEQLNLRDEIKWTILGEEGLQYRKINPTILSLFGTEMDIVPIIGDSEQDRFHNRIQTLETITLISKIPQMAEKLDWNKTLKLLLENAKVRGVHDFLVDDSDQSMSIPPEFENLIMLHEPIAVRQADDDQIHMTVHKAFMDSDAFQDEPLATQMLFQAHVLQHEEKQKSSQQTQPGPQPAPPIAQGTNMANILSATNAGSLSPQNQPAPEAMPMGA